MEHSNTYILIMAGGVGSRFWPKSRDNFPKQFIDILGIGKSLLQLTYERFLKVCPKENIFILTNKTYADLVHEQLPELIFDHILLEPSRNNTAPCIAYATYRIAQTNRDANIVVAPSDHLILKEELFLAKIGQALSFSKNNDALLTLGITPTRPDTGYGYINFSHKVESDIYKVQSFMEKPVRERAEEYLRSGDYLWNAGIFIWSSRSLISGFEKYAPEIAEIFKKGEIYYNTTEEEKFVNDNYPLSPNISIDYAILEKADNVYTIPADIGWSDLGTWASLHAVAEKDSNQNVLNSLQISLKDTKNCIVNLPEGKGALIRGLDNYIVVDDGKVLMIYPKNEEQEIKAEAKEMVDRYGAHFR